MLGGEFSIKSLLALWPALRQLFPIQLDLNAPEARRIFYSTFYSLIFALIVVLYNIAFFALEQNHLVLYTTPFFAAYFGVIALNKLGFFSWARWLLILNANLVIFVFCLLLGESAKIHYWYFAAVVMPFLFFNLSQWSSLLFSAVLPMALLLGLDLSGFPMLSPLVRDLPVSIQQITEVLSAGLALPTLFSLVFWIAHDYRGLSIQNTALQSLHDSYVRALDACSIVGMTDAKGQIVYANQLFQNLSGYSQEELLGKDHRIVNSSFHSKEFFRGMWNTILRGKIWRGKIRNRAKQGNLYWVDTTIVPIFDKDGKVDRFLSIRREITKEMQDERSQAVTARLAAIGEMASGISHEINNPLAIVLGKLVILKRQLEQLELGVHREKVEHTCNRMQAAVDRMVNIVRTMRGFVGDSSQETKIPCLVQDLVRDALVFCEERVALQGIELRNLCSNSDLTLECRPTQVVQILLNLLGNSIFAVQSLGTKWIELSVAKEGQSIVLRVKDSGPGIDPSIVGKLFDPFFTTKEAGGGTGLGLSLSAGFARDHGGVLFYDDSSPNTCFVLSIPQGVA